MINVKYINIYTYTNLYMYRNAFLFNPENRGFMREEKERR